MINISERPKEADDRAIPGHWEGDLILGSTASGSAIGTLVERTTGFVVLLHLPDDRTAATLADAMSIKVPDIPEILRRSLTWDQGSEMALHTKITEADRTADLLLRPAQPLAARHQREHQRTTAPILPQRHRPVVLRPRLARPGRRRTQRPTPQTPQLAHPRRRTPNELLSDPSTFVAATA